SRLRRRPWHRRSPRRGRRERSRLAPGASPGARLPAASPDLFLVVIIHAKSTVDGPLAGEGIGTASGLAQGFPIYLSRQVPDKLPLHDGAPDGRDLIFGIGVEVEADYLTFFAVTHVLEGLGEFQGLHKEFWVEHF